MREETAAKLRARFEQALESGDLPQGGDPDALSRFLLDTAWGMAVAGIEPKATDAACNPFPLP